MKEIRKPCNDDAYAPLMHLCFLLQAVRCFQLPSYESQFKRSLNVMMPRRTVHGTVALMRSLDLQVIEKRAWRIRTPGPRFRNCLLRYKTTSMIRHVSVGSWRCVDSNTLFRVWCSSLASGDRNKSKTECPPKSISCSFLCERRATYQSRQAQSCQWLP